MKIVIHACPQRMWYVNEFLLPVLNGEDVTVWNDTAKRGNLFACMDAFAACDGAGGAWHIQDDVLPARDFVRVAARHEGNRVVCGFVNEYAGPDCNLRGEVYAADMWYSFPCIYIPNTYARECADWVTSGAWEREADPRGWALYESGSGDDWFFREFMEARHGADKVINLAPNLVEHVDFLLGGSAVNPWRGFLARSAYWEDDDLVENLKQRIKERHALKS